MKLKTLEKIIAFTILFLLLLKLSNIYALSFLLFLLCFGMSIVYCTMSIGIFRNNKLNRPFKGHDENKQQTVLSALLGLGIGMCTVGFAWYLIALPGNRVILSAGIIALAVLIPCTVLLKKRFESSFVKSALTRGVVYLGFALFLILIPKHAFLKIQYRNHPEYVEAVIKLHENPSDSTYIEELSRINKKMKSK